MKTNYKRTGILLLVIIVLVAAIGIGVRARYSSSFLDYNNTMTIVFRDNIDRPAAENILNQYTKNQVKTTGFNVDVSTASWNIFQGRLYDLELEAKNSDPQKDVDALQNDQLFQIVETYCEGSSLGTCIHLSSKEDADHDSILSFIQNKGYTIRDENTTPICAEFTVPKKQLSKWYNRLKLNENFKSVDLEPSHQI